MITKRVEDKCEINCIHQDSVERAKEHSLPEQTAYRVAETFKALSDPTRIKIVNALSKEELCVCDLAAALKMGQSAVSHQLRHLRNLRLVKFRKEGKVTYYSLDDTHILDLFNCCLEHINHL